MKRSCHLQLRLILLLLLCLLPALALGQEAPERELEVAKSLYDAGQYGDALARIEVAMRSTNFSEPQRLELLRLAGLSAFNLGDSAAARAHFLALLRKNPDCVLDPFSVSPPAIRLFEQVRTQNAAALNLARQELALKAAQAQREAADRERLEREALERRRRLENLAQTVTLRTVEHRALWVALFPFGAGQFQEGRTALGLTLAIAEGIVAALSITSYFAIESLFRTQTYTWADRLTADGKPFEITVRRIPPERRQEAQVWNTLKWGSGSAFYALWALGVAHALFHFQSEVVTESQVPLRAQPSPAAGAHVSLVPLAGGLGAAFRMDF